MSLVFISYDPSEISWIYKHYAFDKRLNHSVVSFMAFCLKYFLWKWHISNTRMIQKFCKIFCRGHQRSEPHWIVRWNMTSESKVLGLFDLVGLLKLLQLLQNILNHLVTVQGLIAFSSFDQQIFLVSVALCLGLNVMQKILN